MTGPMRARVARVVDERSACGRVKVRREGWLVGSGPGAARDASSRHHLQVDRATRRCPFGPRTRPDEPALHEAPTLPTGAALIYHTSNPSSTTVQASTTATPSTSSTHRRVQIKLAARTARRSAEQSIRAARSTRPTTNPADTTPHRGRAGRPTRDSTAAGCARSTRCRARANRRSPVLWTARCTTSATRRAARSSSPQRLAAPARRHGRLAHRRESERTRFAAEGVDITAAGSGLQYLIVDLRRAAAARRSSTGSVAAACSPARRRATRSRRRRRPARAAARSDIKSRTRRCRPPDSDEQRSAPAPRSTPARSTSRPTTAPLSARTPRAAAAARLVGDADAHTSNTTDTTIIIDTGAQARRDGRSWVTPARTASVVGRRCGQRRRTLLGRALERDVRRHAHHADDRKGTVTAGGSATIQATTAIKGTATPTPTRTASRGQRRDRDGRRELRGCDTHRDLGRRARDREHPGREGHRGGVYLTRWRV